MADPASNTPYPDAAATSASPPSTTKRQRAKQACEPCRLRKRRCNGELACNMCTQFDYKCYYERHPRKRSKLVEATADHDLRLHPTDYIKHEVAREDRPNSEDVSKLRNMEANSGIAFTRLLGQRLDPSGGAKMFSFGWNLGAGSRNRAVVTTVTDFLSYEQMEGLAELYFTNVHPLYGFLDKEGVMQQIRVRWAQSEACTVPDHLFANIAACGSLFTDGAIQEVVPLLVDSAKKSLDSTSMMQPPTLVDAQSWLVRCLYLRATEHPHAVHLASATLMHIIESLGLHQESTCTTPNVPSADREQDAEIRRRTFWVARMLNTWVSFEYGRTRVHLRGINTELPTPQEGDFTTDYIQLYSLSCCLDPERDDSKWEEFLRQMEAYEVRHDCIELSRANLAMCGYRRLRLANPNLSTETMNRIIKLGLNGLDAARRMLEKNMPWWHVANVPFQVVCVFLAMDVRESLSRVGAAMRVLEDVVDGFKTVAMKDALKTARFLIRLSKKRKDEDSQVLGLSLRKGGIMVDESRAESVQPGEHEVNTMGRVNGGCVEMEGGDLPLGGGPATGSSSDEWSLDALNADFDWNFFLSADMPAFDGFVPDGTM